MMFEQSANPFKLVAALGLGFFILIGGGLASCSAYNGIRVWNAETAGEAELAQAKHNRQIAVLEAQAKFDSAKMFADAEVARAKGVAAANDIIMDRLGGPRNYLAYLQIQAMENSKGALIYIPTEAGLPITEAGRRHARDAEVQP